MTTYFSFAIADSMFNGNVEIVRGEIAPELAKDIVNAGCISALNPSHAATIAAASSRYGINPTIPEKAPQVSLKTGDSMIVMSVRGLPRLDATRHEYTSAEIERATFVFSLWTVASI
jgi:hypothetical protein